MILAVTVLIGVLLWAWERVRSRRHGNTLHHHNAMTSQKNDEDALDSHEGNEPPAVCCGLHAICEKTGQINEPPVYYDDEELDRFAGRAADDYNDAETEEFRDVMLTLLPADVPGWAVSIERRRIALPETLKPELDLLLMESSNAGSLNAGVQFLEPA